MSRYIDAEIALQIIKNYEKTVDTQGKCVINAIRDIISDITPTTDVKPIVYAEWQDDECTNCHTWSNWDYLHCPECGAIMKGGKSLK